MDIQNDGNLIKISENITDILMEQIEVDGVDRLGKK